MSVNGGQAHQNGGEYNVPDASFDSPDDIVISGVSGRYPDTENTFELEEKLFSGTDLVIEDGARWPPGMYGLPTRYGRLKDISKFDSMVFNIHGQQAELMDAQGRMFMELTFEALLDAGLNPSALRGSNTGVFIGSQTFDYYVLCGHKIETRGAYSLTGSCRNMLANRTSYGFHFTGPSFAIDVGSLSGGIALHEAVNAIKAGKCDVAIVGGSQIWLQPLSLRMYDSVNCLSRDGKCRAFDANGSGYVMSEGVVALVLQKASTARRVYATVVNSRRNHVGDMKNPDNLEIMQKELFRETLAEVGVSPSSVEFLEANGTGIQREDIAEINAAAEVLCENRTKPLLIGSVKSNMGHAGAASSLMSIVKVLLAMEKGTIPPNLYYDSPNPNIPALCDGRLKVVSENTAYKGGYIAVNSFDIHGTNWQVLLKPNRRTKALAITEKIPRLVTLSGRTQEGVTESLQKLETDLKDHELYSLLDELHTQNITKHDYRGYTLVGSKTPVRAVENYSGDTRPIWFVCSGMGTQWSGMGKDLMQLEPFAKSINKSAECLKEVGFDLIKCIMDSTDDDFENVINSFTTVTSVQVALIDVLKYVGINPDGIIGHSIGEVACGYADGCLTAEQCVLASYFRARAIKDTKLPPGKMAVVGLTWDEVKRRAPPAIVAACHNASNSVTISGPPKDIDSFLEVMEKEQVFNREVKISGIAFHSRYIADSGPKLLSALKKVITDPKPRSSRWISTSVPKDQWDTDVARTCSPEYQTNNLLSPVLFVEALNEVPANAVVIEIAPHCLLQSPLKKAMPSAINVGLNNRTAPDNLDFFLSSLGKMYMSGLYPKISNLYQSVTFPVSRGTPMISPLVKWDHSASWFVPEVVRKDKYGPGEMTVKVNLETEELNYLKGHSIQGQHVIPVAFYLETIWKFVAEARKTTIEQQPLVFENIHFHQHVRPTGETNLLLNVLSGMGSFGILVGDCLVVSGSIIIPEEIDKVMLDIPALEKESGNITLQKKDIYDDLSVRGYNYDGKFQNIIESTMDGSVSKLKWENNWVTLLDSMLQLNYVKADSRSVKLPAGIQRVVIHPNKHLKIIANRPEEEEVEEETKEDNENNEENGEKKEEKAVKKEEKAVKKEEKAVKKEEKKVSKAVPDIEYIPLDELPAFTYNNIGVTKCGGIEIRGVHLSDVSFELKPTVESYTFIPYVNKSEKENTTPLSINDALKVCLDIALENTPTQSIKIAELTTPKTAEFLSLSVLDMLKLQSNIEVECTVFSTSPMASEIISSDVVRIEDKSPVTALEPGCNLLYGRNLITSSPLLAKLSTVLNGQRMFILLEDTVDANIEKGLNGLSVDIVADHIIGKRRVVLLKVKENEKHLPKTVIRISGKSFTWVNDVKKAMNASQNVILVAENEPVNGILGLVNGLRLYSGTSKLQSVFIRDSSAPKFSVDFPEFRDQLHKGLLYNVFQNGQWGSMRHLPVEFEKQKVDDAYVGMAERGNISSLSWIKSPPSKSSEDKINVYYTPLNNKDVLMATGKLTTNEDYKFGQEFIGRDANGRRVMGLVPQNALATAVTPDPNLLWEVPDKWSMEEAATVPYVYATAYYALVSRGNVKSNRSIFIMESTTDIGEAAVFVALSLGCKVFVSAKDVEEREHLKRRFPSLNDESIVSHFSKSDLERHIKLSTKGKGVDIIFNPISDGVLRKKLLTLLAAHGTYIELKDDDRNATSGVEMGSFLHDCTLVNVEMDVFISTGSSEDKKCVQKLLENGLKTGVAKPLPKFSFSKYQLKEAFKSLETKSYFGKVILKVRDEEKEKDDKPTPVEILAVPVTYLNSEDVYVLVGGLNSFGFELAFWMSEHGATKLVISSPETKNASSYEACCLHRLKHLGVTVKMSRSDCSTPSGSSQLLKEASSMGNVGGIFYMNNMVNSAGLLHNQTPESFKSEYKSKMEALQNLDDISRKQLPNLHHFVAFSTISSIRCLSGQANIGYINSAVERLCEKRCQEGLPAKVVQWGAIKENRVHLDNPQEVESSGTLPQSISSCLQVFDKILHQAHTIVSSGIATELKRPMTQIENISEKEERLNSGVPSIANGSHAKSTAQSKMSSVEIIAAKKKAEQSKLNAVPGFKEAGVVNGSGSANGYGSGRHTNGVSNGSHTNGVKK